MTTVAIELDERRRQQLHDLAAAQLRDEAEAIFLRYGDAKLSLTDCTSFALLAVRPVDEVFGHDAHLEMMGHILQPKG